MRTGLNRLFDLEREIGRQKKVEKRPAFSKARSLTRPYSPKVMMLSRPVDYEIPGPIAHLKQPSPDTCWAAVAAMLISWREQASFSIEDALAKVGERWLKLFKDGRGLPVDDAALFAGSAGFIIEYPQDFTIPAWEGLLRTYGPLWVGTDEKLGKGFRGHIRVITGIKGDGTSGGTSLSVIDPASGNAFKEKFSAFLAKYEEAAVELKTKKLPIQVIHLPKDASKSVPQQEVVQVKAHGPEARAYSVEPDDSDWYSEEDLKEEAPTVSPQGYIEAYGLARSDAKWADDASSPDYRHLEENGISKVFTFSAAHLEDLCKSNLFDYKDTSNNVLFALRGCRPANNSSSAFAPSIQLSEDVPDHYDFHCVLGVWKPAEGLLVGYKGSTVPNWRHMERQRSLGGQKANMLLSGRYIYTVGSHRSVQGAFIQQKDVVVLRSNEDLIYETTDIYERHSPQDNIHPGFRDRAARFSSAGCSTVPGFWSNTKGHTGIWADFRRSAGLSEDNRSKWGEKFIYIILSGREARLISEGKSPSELKRLRFGSKGAAVEALQMGLKKEGLYKGSIDGEVGKNTAWAYIRWQQKTNGGSADGIVTPGSGRKLGFDLITDRSMGKSVVFGMAAEPWSTFFSFPKGTAFEVDGPGGYNGKGKVLDRTDSTLKFEVQMPEYTVPVLGYNFPKSDLLFELIYRKEGDGNTAKIAINGKIFEDRNISIQSDTKESRRTFIPSIAIPDLNIQKIAIASEGTDEVDLDVQIDGSSYDFDLNRLKSEAAGVAEYLQVNLVNITHAGPYRIAYDRLTQYGVIEPLPGRNTRNFRGDPRLQTALNDWANHIPQVENPPNYILTGGLYVNKAGAHGQGLAVDVDGLWWSDTNKFLANQAPQDWYRYLRIEATLRKVFGIVLNYDYNAAHQDHWHCDLTAGTQWRGVKSQAKFAQRVLTEIFKESLNVDGVWGTLSKEAAQRAGFDFTASGHWDRFLDDLVKGQCTTP